MLGDGLPATSGDALHAFAAFYLDVLHVTHRACTQARLELENLAQLPFRPQHAIDHLMEEPLGTVEVQWRFFAALEVVADLGGGLR